MKLFVCIAFLAAATLGAPEGKREKRGYLHSDPWADAWASSGHIELPSFHEEHHFEPTIIHKPKIISINKFVDVPKVVHVKKIITVPKVISVPQLVKVEKVVHEPELSFSHSSHSSHHSGWW